MLIDARTLPDGHLVETDVCVVGAGPAGITLARELGAGPRRVCVLESGGPEFEEETQALADGETTGDPIQPLTCSRRRQFGGTSHIWNSGLGEHRVGFRCGPLDEVDFEKKEWLPHSGWPFDRSHLDPFYERAQTACGLGPYCYDARRWGGPPALPFDERVIGTDVWQFGPQTAFTQRYREELEEAPRVAVYLHANALELETNEAATAVTALRAACLNGGPFRVSAKVFILAAGGVENPRLLLLSNRAQPPGLGNHHGLVGRFFMEHQLVRCGTLTPASRELFNRTALYDARPAGGVKVMGKLQFSAAVLRRERLLNLSVALYPKHGRYRRFRQDSVDSLAALLSAGRRLRVPDDAATHVRRVLSGADYVFAAACRKATRGRLFPFYAETTDLLNGGGWSTLDRKEKRYSVFEVLMHAEQAPDPENRVTLADELDALGCRKARLHWRWGEADIDSVLRAQRLLAAEFARAGLGSLRVELDGGRPHLLAPGLHHHMGTTRMHADPRQGVVDENCRIHGLGNLFVAGSSVFPTGGYINPTLTIVALAIRLADHLRGGAASGAVT